MTVDQTELAYLYHVIKRHEEVGKEKLDICHLRFILTRIFPEYEHPMVAVNENENQVQSTEEE